MKGRKLAAYVIGGALVLLGVLGLLVELSKGKPSSTHLYGYGLALLFMAYGVIIFLGIRYGAMIKGRRLAAYIIDGALVLLGVLGLLVELNKGKPSSTNFYGYVFAFLLLLCGVIVFLGIRSAYGGGAWSLFGLLLVAAASARFTSLLQGLINGRELRSPIIFFSTLTALWGAGCYCLAWGHIRRRREEPNPQDGANGSQPFGSDTSRTSAAAVSRRSS